MKKHLRGTPAHEARKTEMAERRAKYHAQPAPPQPRSTIKFRDSDMAKQFAVLMAAQMAHPHYRRAR